MNAQDSTASLTSWELAGPYVEESIRLSETEPGEGDEVRYRVADFAAYFLLHLASSVLSPEEQDEYAAQVEEVQAKGGHDFVLPGGLVEVLDTVLPANWRS